VRKPSAARSSGFGGAISEAPYHHGLGALAAADRPAHAWANVQTMAGAKNACAGPFGAFYDAWIERERVAAVVGRVLWGIDTGPMYKSMREALAELPDDATILDVPCGGGVAFRALRPEQRVRYLAADIDEAMLARARRRADRLGLGQVEVLSADMRQLPFDDGVADLGLTYSGLHMIPDPELAIAEMARCIRSGGRIVGTTFLAGGSRRKRLLFAAGARTGHAAPDVTQAELTRWLADAGFTDTRLTGANAFLLFSARKT
jgi:SAM-dependent methyltransferase